MLKDSDTPRRLETARELAQFLNVSVAAIRKWTRNSDFPVLRCGRACRYEREKVLAFLQARSEAKKASEQ